MLPAGGLSAGLTAQPHRLMYPRTILQAISQAFHTVFVEGVPSMDMQV